MEQDYQTNQGGLDTVILIIGIIFVIVVVTNITSIIISYYSLKEEIDTIENEDLKVDLLQDLNPIWRVFLKRLFYHNEEDFFNDSRLYRHLLRTRIGIRMLGNYESKIKKPEEEEIKIAKRAKS